MSALKESLLPGHDNDFIGNPYDSQKPPAEKVQANDAQLFNDPYLEQQSDVGNNQISETIGNKPVNSQFDPQSESSAAQNPMVPQIPQDSQQSHAMGGQQVLIDPPEAQTNSDKEFDAFYYPYIEKQERRRCCCAYCGCSSCCHNFCSCNSRDCCCSHDCCKLCGDCCDLCVECLEICTMCK